MGGTMKIFAAGIATESNTFCPEPTALEDYQVLRGRDVRAGRMEYPGLNLEDLWGADAKAAGADFIFSLMAWAEPSGTTIRAAYESLRDEVLADLKKAMPVDIVLLNLHGAMVAQGHDDCEGDLMARIRAITGPDTVIAAELDLHCNLFPEKLAAADIIITYKEYPHIDVRERAREVFALALAAKTGKIKPVMALVPIPMVGLYPTTAGPLKSFLQRVRGLERDGTALSISFAHCFPFQDLPVTGASVIVITDNDKQAAQTLAEQLAAELYAMRRDIGFDRQSLPMDAALQRALDAPRGPVVVADQSDNSGAGAPSDATFALKWLLDKGAGDIAIASFYDPEVVRIARKAGTGADITIRLGGKSGPAGGTPLDLQVRVGTFRSNYFHAHAQSEGPPRTYPMGDTVALHIGSIAVIVGSRKCQCYSPDIFTDFGIAAREKKILVPKSMQHFHNAFAPIAASVLYMAAPGATPPDPRAIAYTRLDTASLYPWKDG